MARLQPPDGCAREATLEALLRDARTGVAVESDRAIASIYTLACTDRANRDVIRRVGGVAVLVGLARVGADEQKKHAVATLGVLAGDSTRMGRSRLAHSIIWVLRCSLLTMCAMATLCCFRAGGGVTVASEDARCAADYDEARGAYGVVSESDAIDGLNTLGRFLHHPHTHADGVLGCTPVGIRVRSSIPPCLKYRTLLHEIVHYHQCAATYEQNRLVPPEQRRALQPLRPIGHYESHVDGAMFHDVTTLYPPEFWDVEFEARVLASQVATHGWAWFPTGRSRRDA